MFVVVALFFVLRAERVSSISDVPDLVQGTLGTGIEPAHGSISGSEEAGRKKKSCLCCLVKFSSHKYSMRNCSVLVLQAAKLWLVQIYLRYHGLPRP